MRSIFKAVAVTAAIAFSATEAQAQACTDATVMTSYSFYVDCEGSFAGNLNGSAGEMTNLTTYFGGTWTWQGKSDDSGFGFFTSNPGGTSGTLSFDSPITGLFVVGLKAGPRYSFYLFDGGVSGISSVPFSTEGTSMGGVNPNALSHAGLYFTSSTSINTVPEPSTYALMGAGLLAVGFASRRRRA